MRLSPLPALLLAAVLAVAAGVPSQCTLRPIVGPCNARLRRYYWDIESGTCKSFNWGGCKGQVPFQTLELCKKAKCNERRCQFPGITGRCRASIPKYFYNQIKKKCEKFTWGGCGGLVPFHTLAACQGKCEPAPVDRCKLKPAKGPCRGSFTRYYFDPAAKTCKSFVWGGCGGKVSFTTLADCETKCQCALRPAKGTCRARIPRYFFDKRTRTCKRFFWGGCKGVVPFDTLDACRLRCPINRCKLAPAPGPCRARKPRFYYNQKSSSCKRFIWGGCKGVVPFVTLAQCENKCDA